MGLGGKEGDVVIENGGYSILKESPRQDGKFMTQDPKVISVMSRLKAMGSETDQDYGARFGIQTELAYGVKTPELRTFAKELGKDHELALLLWNEPAHEAKKRAAMLADPKKSPKRLWKTGYPISNLGIYATSVVMSFSIKHHSDMRKLSNGPIVPKNL
ncbi:MAG: DNA alkylation repair protein [Chloroflexi bacterium]|nr:DNA alkylation repair protein [Chloroflexota bacterium]